MSAHCNPNNYGFRSSQMEAAKKRKEVEAKMDNWAITKYNTKRTKSADMPERHKANAVHSSHKKPHSQKRSSLKGEMGNSRHN